MHGLVWVALWTAPVFAQPALDDTPEEAATPPEEPAALEAAEAIDEPVRAVPVHDTHSWFDAVPVDADTRVFMDLTAVGPRGLAVDGGGGVWRTEDAGSRWRRVLEPLARISGPGDHDPAPIGANLGDNSLEYRARELADELADDRDGDEFDYDYDGADTYGSGDLDATDSEDAEGDGEVADSEGDSLQSELTQEVALDGLLRDAQAAGLLEGTMRLGGVAWLHPDLPDLALVGRADGIWRSLNGGRDWARVDPLGTATAFLAGPGNLMLAGSADGLKYSVDRGRTWLDKDDPMDGQRVRDLAAGSDGTWWCATNEGLYTSQEGEYWETVPLEGIRVRDVRALLLEPGGDASLLLADNETLYRTDDGGQTVIPLGRQPLLDTTRLLTLPGAGHVVASGSDGVWESVDGGMTWRPVASGLKDPQVFDLVLLDGRLLAATLDGLMRLAEGRPVAELAEGAEPPTAPEVDLDAPPLHLVVLAATDRMGVDPSIYTPSKMRKARLLPALQLYGRYDWGRTRDTDLSSPPTSEAYDRDFTIYASVGWGGLVSSSDIDVVVMDDMVFVDIGDLSGGLPVMAASNTRKMIAYRFALIDLVTELYLSRQQLLKGWAGIPPDDLRAQTLHVLQIQEVTARLDGYTDGAFTRASVPPENP